MLVLGMEDERPHDVLDDELSRILSEREPDFSAKICEGLDWNDLDEKTVTIMKQKYADRQVRVLISKMESLGMLQRKGERRGVRYLQTERFARMF